MNFLPEDYESPKSNSGYMKIQEGDNKIRILTSPIIGWEDWTPDRKPIRFRREAKPDKPLDPKKPLKHFWAFIVWDYATSRISILEITQASVRKAIESLSRDEDWGSPFNYDIKITRSGKGVDTEYEVKPVSLRELDLKIKEEFEKLPICLEELFVGGDPFATTPADRTKGFWEVAPSVKNAPVEYITTAQVNTIEQEIHTWIAKADPEWRKRALAAMKVDSFSVLPKKFFDLTMKRIEEKKNELISEDIPF